MKKIQDFNKTCQLIAVVIMLWTTQVQAEELADLIKAAEQNQLSRPELLDEIAENIKSSKDFLKQHQDASHQDTQYQDTQNIDPSQIYNFLDPDAKEASAIPLSQANEPELYIFISFAMPKKLIEEYYKTSEQYNARLVLRGFKENSFRQTVNMLQEFLADSGAAIIIDPNLFEQYNITQVPSFVQTKDGKIFNKLTGAVSVAYVMDQFGQKADEGGR